MRVRIRLTPNAQKDRIDGISIDEQGNGLLRIAVNAIPENGRANKALIKYLAKQWKVPKSRIKLVHGAKDRLKTLHIEGDGLVVSESLRVWAETLT